jgi:MFS family permease
MGSQLSLPMTEVFALNPTTWSSFIAIFSLGYGLMQFVTGFVLNKTGARGLSIFSALLGINMWLLSMQTNFNTILLLNFFNGVFASGSVIGLSFYLTSYWPSHTFNAIFNIGMYLGYKLAVVLSSLFKPLLTTASAWPIFFKYMGVVFMVIGILIAILFTMLPQAKTTKDTSVSIVEGVKSFASDNLLVNLALYSATSVVLMFVFQIGYLDTIISTFYSKSLLATDVLNQFFNNACAISTVILPLSLMFICAESLMLISAFIQVIGMLVLIFLHKTSIYAVFFGLAAVALGGSAHNIAPIIVGERYKGQITSIYFGALNFFAMLIGCTSAQQAQGYLLNMLCAKSTLNGTILITSYMYWTIGAVIALLISAYIFFTKKCDVKCHVKCDMKRDFKCSNKN